MGRHISQGITFFFFTVGYVAVVLPVHGAGGNKKQQQEERKEKREETEKRKRKKIDGDACLLVVFLFISFFSRPFLVHAGFGMLPCKRVNKGGSEMPLRLRSHTTTMYGVILRTRTGVC